MSAIHAVFVGPGSLTPIDPDLAMPSLSPAADPRQDFADSFGAAVATAHMADELAQAVDEDDADELLRTYAVLQQATRSLEARMKDVRRAVEDLMVQTASARLVGEAATASWTAGYERVSYDSKALDVLCRADDELAATLSPYRKVTEIAPALKIEVTR